MRRKSVMVLFYSITLVLGTIGIARAQNISDIEPFQKDDRILILAPHPDDEAIACAGLIQQAQKAGAEVRIAYLTNGDNNQFAFIVYEKRLTFRKGEFIHMGEVRRKEAINAMKFLGLGEDRLIFLGYPDFGTFTIFSRYWQSKAPFRSMLTRVSSVPYKNDFSFGAPYTGESILGDLKKIISDYKPTKIFVSHPADVNVDHKTLYLFLEVALADLKNQIPKAAVYPYLVHHAGWPSPRHYHPELNLKPPKNIADSRISWYKRDLTAEELEKKHRAILCYKSQTMSSAFYLLSFARKNELYGTFPEIRLKRQVSLQERSPEFFGFTKMFSHMEDKGEFSEDRLMEDQGQVSYAVVDNCFLIRVEEDEDIKRSFGLILYAFGYSSKTPFAAMPKLRIIARYKKFRIYDGKKMIKPDGVNLKLNHKELLLRIPLSVLGGPDFVLTSAKAYGGKIPADATAFRKIVIKQVNDK